MQQITKVSIGILKVHPRNVEFFDDIEGKDYEQFKKSIEEDGIITPLIVAPDMTIISGHQRFKAATDLGIKQIPVIIREDLEDEDEKLKKLLATNFGRTKNDPSKQRKVAVQYVELCGTNKRGNPQLGDNRPFVTQEQIAQELGISHRVLKELLEIERKLTPEIKQLLDEGIISKTSASKIWTKLSDDEQLELLEELGADKLKEMTQKQLQSHLYEKRELEKRIKELENRPQTVEVEKIVEVIPNDVEELIDSNKQLMKEICELKEELKGIEDSRSEQHRKMQKELKEKVDTIYKQKKQIEQLSKVDTKEEHIKKLKYDALFFCNKIHTFVGDVGGLAWMTEYIDELPEQDKKEYLKALSVLDNWIETVKTSLGMYGKVDENVQEIQILQIENTEDK